MQDFLVFLNEIPTFLKAISVTLSAVLLILQIKAILKKHTQEKADIQRRVELKEMEIDTERRNYARNREIRFRELRGYVVDRNGPSERFDDYENKLAMDDFDMAHREKMDILMTELRHLLSLQGNTLLIIPQKTLLQKLQFWKK